MLPKAGLGAEPVDGWDREMAVALRLEARNQVCLTCELKLSLVPPHRELDTQSWARDSVMN